MDTSQYVTGKINIIQAGQRLDYALTKVFPEYSRSQLKNCILQGLVKINGIIVTIPKNKVSGNENIEIYIQPIIKHLYFEAQNIPLDIIYEDIDIIILNKPANLIVHPGAGHNNGTILNALLYHYPNIINVPRAGIVHRLDKDTTGLMIIAKTIDAHINLIKSFHMHKIIREYEAIAIGNIITSGTVNAPILRNICKKKNMIVHPLGKPAITHYYVITHFRNHTQLRLRLETGRTHQIRVHMAYINHPLVGDQLYGKRNYSIKHLSETCKTLLHQFNRQALHSVRLQCNHPTKATKMEWRVPLPKDMTVLLQALQKDTYN